MTEFKLQPVDILVNVNRKNDPWSRIRRWAVGPHSHVFMYMGFLRLATTRYGHPDNVYPKAVPMLFESNGRGAVLQSLANRYGQEVVVMRLKPEYQRKIHRILTEAIKLASDLQSYYDYTIITLHIIPKVIFEKLHLPIPLKYQRDEKMICSEAVLEAFLRAKVPVLPKDVVPLPGSFLESDLLAEVGQGVLSEDWL